MSRSEAERAAFNMQALFANLSMAAQAAEAGEDPARVNRDMWELARSRPAFMSKTCRVCSKAATKRCGTCRDTSYCSAACQRADWPTHKRCCQTAKKIYSAPRDDAGFASAVASALGLPPTSVEVAAPLPEEPEICAICLDALDYKGGHIYLNCCSHFVHLECAQKQMRHGNPLAPRRQRCALCRQVAVPPGARGDRMIVERLRGHCARGNSSAQYQMGCDTLSGNVGLSRDAAEACRLLEASTASGTGIAATMSCSKLAHLYVYDRTVLCGNQGTVNPESQEVGAKGLEFALRAARQGDAYGPASFLGARRSSARRYCMYVLGDCYANGYFCDKDHAKAVSCMASAAFNGYPQAKQQLAHVSWDKASMRVASNPLKN